jgi:hypothetical protein
VAIKAGTKSGYKQRTFHDFQESVREISQLFQNPLLLDDLFLWRRPGTTKACAEFNVVSAVFIICSVEALVCFFEEMAFLTLTPYLALRTRDRKNNAKYALFEMDCASCRIHKCLLCR